MGLHKKYSHLLSLKPDIAVVQEVARPDVVEAKAGRLGFTPDCLSGSLVQMETRTKG